MSINRKNEDSEKIYLFSRSEKIAFVCLIVLAVNYVLKFYVSEEMYQAMIYPTEILFLFVGFKQNNFRIKFRNSYECYYIVVYIIVFISSIAYSLLTENANAGIAESILIYFAIVTAFLYKNLSVRYLEKVFKVIGIIAVILFLLTISRTGIDIASALGRGYQWTEIFYYTSPFCFSVPFVILAFIRGEKRLLSLVIFLSYFMLEMIVVKRIVLLETVVLFAILLIVIFAKQNRFKSMLNMVVIMFICITVLWLIAGDDINILLNSVFERTVSATDDITGFDRAVEATKYLKEINPYEIIFGRGFFGSHYELGIAATALHIGWANFMFKGGVLLLSVILIPYIKLLSLINEYQQLSEKTKFAVCYLLFSFPVLFVSSLHEFDPKMFLFFFCCLEVMSAKPENNIKSRKLQ